MSKANHRSAPPETAVEEKWRSYPLLLKIFSVADNVETDWSDERVKEAEAIWKQNDVPRGESTGGVDLLKDLIGSGHLILLIGVPFSGKSLLLGHIYASMQWGLLPFDLPNSADKNLRPLAKVLYLDYENGREEFHDRLRDFPDDFNPYYYIGSNFISAAI